ncbi:conjugal transfer protein TrbD [Xylella fastidiosa]|uniref:conjugal transfer protein TrbD n=2 Tax=Xylella fastidiosa TaxID=2371 RepID=UPI000774B5D6|nr:conjugal transfer protein TrbD [Xylella fastidiosa]NMR46195.1 conjugal transfer protein TrbD [Xylella fastidiosa]TNV90244.1 conjugal transfer protein TrbD [Xylella fastidiosa]TNV93764.1 conjugal transfer protein TrbD [Xylella fastidiosa]TNW00730.1 conjugal transfer protein TrbD [Xylella fastidiosa]TNW06944.1 conjugal transfer protein TrbD [Xylella fastidiosa]
MVLPTIPIRRVGNRDNLFMGGDREMVMFSGLLCAILIFEAQDWIAAGFGLGMWFLALWLFRKIAKADPRMRFVYMRNRRYKAYYPPRATPFRNNTASQGNQYKCFK